MATSVLSTEMLRDAIAMLPRKHMGSAILPTMIMFRPCDMTAEQARALVDGLRYPEPGQFVALPEGFDPRDVILPMRVADALELVEDW